MSAPGNPLTRVKVLAVALAEEFSSRAHEKATARRELICGVLLKDAQLQTPPREAEGFASLQGYE